MENAKISFLSKIDIVNRKMILQFFLKNKKEAEMCISASVAEKQILTTEESRENEYADNNLMEGNDEGSLEIEKEGRVIIEKNDRSLAEFLRWYDKGKLIINPEWQRQYVWDEKRASKLVESFIMDIPIPVVYIARNKLGNYEVIDGLQRLTSIFRFFKNEMKLSGLDMYQEYNGKKFKELPEVLQTKLEDSTLRTFELDERTPKDLMFVIFERLNTGGMALNESEIRNCLYRGKLNDLIKELIKDEDFLKCVSQKNIGKRMFDYAIVLRYLAFHERTYHKCKKGLKKFINEYMDTYRDLSDEKVSEYRKIFKHSMRCCLTIFGDKGFRLKKDTERGSGEWATRVNASVFQCVAVSFVDYDIGQVTRFSEAILEEYLDLISTDAKWVDCVRRATGEPTRLDYVFTTWNDRLKKVLSSSEPNDSQRCFSYALKQEMYKDNNICAICGKRIATINDAAIDHDKHYWRGGKTVPENAKLVHRYCNSVREN